MIAIRIEDNSFVNERNEWRALTRHVVVSCVNLPASFWNDIAPDEAPQSNKPTSRGLTFNRWLINAKDKGNVGEKTRPVNAPKIRRLVLVNLMTQTKIYQATANINPHTHRPLNAIWTGTKMATTAQIKRPICNETKTFLVLGQIGSLNGERERCSLNTKANRWS